MDKPTSYSQNELFEQCPKTWYYKYVLKIPGIEDLTYANRGNVVHKALEMFYKDKSTPLEDIKSFFNKEWTRLKLDNSILKNKKDETLLMIINGINLDFQITSVELKIFFSDVVAYLDMVDTQNHIIIDWKTSTRSEENEKSYLRQLKYYAWLYHRKFSKLPTFLNVRYLKYTGTKSELGHVPTMEDIKELEQWHFEIRNKMQEYIDTPSKIPEFNKNYYFSPYKHLWDLDDKDPNELMRFVIEISGGFIYIKGTIDDFLNKHLKKKFSYELKNAFYIKKARPNANTMVQFWNEKYKRLPIGFLEQVKKTLHDYAEFKKKTPVLTINDKRCFDKTVIENMPDKLLSGKVLRPYQTTAIDIFVNKHDIGALEITTGAGKSLIATEIVRRLKMKTLFVVDKKELLYQIKQTFEENLGLKIGVIGDGIKQIEDVTVATIQTLTKNIEEYKEYLEEVRFVTFDESHKCSAKSYYTLGLHLKNTEKRLSLTATFFRDDGNDMMLTATCGEIIFSLTGQELIEQGYLMKPEIIFIKQKMSKMKILEMTDNSKEGLINEIPKYKLYYDSFITKNEDRNQKIKSLVEEHQNKTILILVKYIEHGKILEEIIKYSKYVYGETNGKIRTDAVSDFKSGKLKVLVSTISIFAEGVDIPALDIVINAAANKGDVKSIQVLGRVLRRKDGKDKAIYYDFADEGIFFRNSSWARIEAFRKEGHAVVIISEEKNEEVKI